MRNRTSTMLHMNIWRQHAAGPLHVMLCCLTFCHLPLVIENGKDKSLVMAIQKAGDLKKKPGTCPSPGVSVLLPVQAPVLWERLT